MLPLTAKRNIRFNRHQKPLGQRYPVAAARLIQCCLLQVLFGHGDFQTLLFALAVLQAKTGSKIPATCKP